MGTGMVELVLALGLTAAAAAIMALAWLTRRAFRRERSATGRLAAMHARAAAGIGGPIRAAYAVDAQGIITWWEGEIGGGVTATSAVARRHGESATGCPDAIEAVAQARRGDAVSIRGFWGALPIDLQARPVFGSSGAIEEVVLSVVDVTEAVRERDRAEQLAGVRTGLVSAMNYNIRAALTGVIGPAELLSRTSLSSQARIDAIDIIRESGSALFAYLRDLVDYAELDAGRVDLSDEPVDFRALLREIVTAHRAEASARHTPLVLRYPATFASEIVTDRRRLLKLVDAVVSLAVRRSEPGFIVLNVEESGRYEDEVALHVTVEHPGIALGPTEAQALGGGFPQASKALAAGSSGEILGLVVAQGLVELMGGSTRSEVLSDGSTVWTLDLSFERSAGAEAIDALVAQHAGHGVPAAVEPKLEARRAEKVPRILIVEADRRAQRTMSHLLSSLGCVTAVAGAVDEVQSALDQGDFDVMIVNDVRPPATWASVISAVRARDDDQAETPILAVTADAMRGSRQPYIDAGADDYLAKPVSAGALRRLIARWTDFEAESSEVSVENLPTAIAPGVLSHLDEARDHEGHSVGAGLVAAFLETVPRLVIQIDDAIRSSDHETVREGLAPVRETARIMGAQALIAKCDSVAAALNGPNAVEAVQALSELRVELGAVVREIRQHPAAA